jgi:hypothetical protein
MEVRAVRARRWFRDLRLDAEEVIATARGMPTYIACLVGIVAAAAAIVAVHPTLSTAWSLACPAAVVAWLAGVLRRWVWWELDVPRQAALVAVAVAVAVAAVVAW